MPAEGARLFGGDTFFGREHALARAILFRRKSHANRRNRIGARHRRGDRLGDFELGIDEKFCPTSLELRAQRRGLGASGLGAVVLRRELAVDLVLVEGGFDILVRLSPRRLRRCDGRRGPSLPRFELDEAVDALGVGRSLIAVRVGPREDAAVRPHGVVARRTWTLLGCGHGGRGGNRSTGGWGFGDQADLAIGSRFHRMPAVDVGPATLRVGSSLAHGFDLRTRLDVRLLLLSARVRILDAVRLLRRPAPTGSGGCLGRHPHGDDRMEVVVEV